MIRLEWRNVANIGPGDIVASLQPRRFGENGRTLANLARRLERGQRPGTVTLQRVDGLGETHLELQVGRVNLRETYRPNVQLPIVSTCETGFDTENQVRETENITATPTGQEA